MDISQNQFNKALTSCGYGKPNSSKYNAFISACDYANISSSREAAMFLAQLIHESGGLQHKKEIGCPDSGYEGCPKYPQNSYYGRGYMQLSHSYNYKSCSEAIYGDDRLLRNPDLVADSEEMCFKTAAWFWKVNVSSVARTGKFGLTTKAINGGLECRGANVSQSKRRFEYYCNVHRAFDVSGTPDESGCYC